MVCFIAFLCAHAFSNLRHFQSERFSQRQAWMSFCERQPNKCLDLKQLTQKTVFSLSPKWRGQSVTILFHVVFFIVESILTSFKVDIGTLKVAKLL